MNLDLYCYWKQGVSSRIHIRICQKLLLPINNNRMTYSDWHKRLLNKPYRAHMYEACCWSIGGWRRELLFFSTFAWWLGSVLALPKEF